MIITVEFRSKPEILEKVIKYSVEEVDVVSGNTDIFTVNYPSIEDYDMMRSRYEEGIPHQVVKVLCDTEWEHGCALIRFKKIIKPTLVRK